MTKYSLESNKVARTNHADRLEQILAPELNVSRLIRTLSFLQHLEGVLEDNPLKADPLQLSNALPDLSPIRAAAELLVKGLSQRESQDRIALDISQP